MTCQIVVLISGNGSNLQALIDDCHNNGVYDISAVISNRADAYGLTRACDANIPTAVIDHKQFHSRQEFDQTLLQSIKKYQADLLVLAGFMRILTAEFVQYFNGRLLNIHPSLLPKYQGLNTHKRALEAGDKEHGASVHYVTEELDRGPVIVQGIVPIEKHDDEPSLSSRVQTMEHRIYPLAVRWFAEQRLAITENGVTFDDQLLPPCGKQVYL